MSITSISSYSSYASMETYASTAAVGNGDQAASAVFSASTVLTDSVEFSQQTTSLTIASNSTESLMEKLSGTQANDEMMKMIVALLVLAYIMGDEQQQEDAMKGLSELLGMESEEISLTISSSTTSFSHTTALSELSGTAQPVAPSAPVESGALLDVMA
jgi:hypothetical protein